MIINNSKFDFSLNDTTELRRLILENPELPLLIFCGEDAWHDDYTYEMAYASKGDIRTLTLYHNKWMNEEEYESELIDDLCDDYEEMSDEEFHQMIEQKIAETEFVEAIVIYVG